MGVAQSSVPTEVAVVGALVAGSLTAYGVYSRNGNVPSKGSEEKAGGGAGGKKGNKKKKKLGGRDVIDDSDFDKLIEAANKENAAAAASARVVRPPDIVPGTFDFNPASNSESEAPGKKAQKKKGKKKAPTSLSNSSQGPSSSVVELKPQSPSPEPETEVPEPSESSIAPPQAAQSSKKSKKRKAGKAGLGTPSTTAGGKQNRPLAASIEMSDVGDDNSWTRVSTRKKATKVPGESDVAAGSIASSNEKASSTDAELLTSDTNLTSGATDPDVTETEEEIENKKSNTVTRKTFAEKMLPKPRKTGVEDMEEEPLQPTLARTIKIKPVSGEKPAKGFSWGDYEEYAGADEGTTSADGDADSAWEEVKSKKRTRGTPSNPALASSTDSLGHSAQSLEEPNKRQRQNAQKREAEKLAKELGEKDRLDRLAQHKRELEKVRIAEQYSSSGKKGVSGGMQAAVGESGKLVWE